MSKIAARNIAHSTLARMNLTPLMMDPRQSALITQNFREMYACEDDDYMEAAEAGMREMLCEAYGIGPASSQKPFAFSNGTAVIPIHGTLINRYGGYYFGYVTGYNFIRRQMAQASVDDDVERIIFDVNSGGGQASGCFELAEEIYALEKPTLAVVDASCYSAAYALASAADTLTVIPSGGAGSIGVVAMHVDVSKMMSDIGINITFITAGAHKADGNPYTELSKEVLANIQSDVNQAYDMFVALVARNRDLDEKAVRDTEAQCYSAQDALGLGLIDAVATPTQAVTAFISGPSGSEEQTEETQMKDDKNTAPENQQASVDANALNGAKTEGAKAESARISGILNCEQAKDRPKLAQHLAFNSTMSVEDASAMLANAGVETQATAPGPVKDANTDPAFTKAMNESQQPNVGANADSQVDDDADDENDLGKNLTRIGYTFQN